MFLKSYLLLSLGASTLCANAYVVARFDLGTTSSEVASGWKQVAVGLNSDNLTSVSGTQNGTTVTVFANTVLDARDRGVNAFHDNEAVNPGGSLSPVLRDWLFDNGNSEGESMTVEFTGLLADTQYSITSIHFETSGGQPTFVTDWYEDSIAPANLLGTWNFTLGSTVSETDFVLLDATSDGTGKITLVADAATGPLRLSGFIVEPVPAASDVSYQIDLDNSETLSGPHTEEGWTSLALVNGSTSGSVVSNGVNFSVSGFAGSRNRFSTNSTTLTRDFVFTSDGSAITMAFGVAGDLPAGVWEVSMWSWDQDVPIAPATVGYRVNGGADVVVGTGLPEDPAYPVGTFQFTSDGVSSYEVFIRDATTGDGNDSVRLNAVSLSLLPTPSATLSGFTYDPSDGSAEVSIQGTPNGRYKLVEAADLDFSNPDRTIPLIDATVGTREGDEVITDGSGNATVQFNLGTAKEATFLRAEPAP